MPRVIKHPEIRRAEIIDAAFQIFLERGYDNTSLNEVIVAAGLSKGMFYHHFESKEVLLEAIFERITEQAFSAIEPIVSAKDLDPRTRLQQLLDRIFEMRLKAVEFHRELVLHSLYRSENNLLYHRIAEAWAERMRPIFTKIIQEGVDAGAFKTDDPEGVGDLIVQMPSALKYLVDRGLNVGTARARDAIADEIDRRLKFHAVALARIMKLSDSTFSIGPPDFAKRFLRALKPIGRGKTAP